MKVAITGKGGVGKTTLAAGLARLWAAEGRRVIAIDADPDANLAIALGADSATADKCIPLSQMDDLIEERTGARPGAGGMFRLNPDVSDVVETCGVDVHGVTLLKMGTVERGGAGCMCSEGVFLKAFMRHLLLERDDVAILDMEAGIEHLGRGTAESVDAFVVVVEPGARSIQTARQVRDLAADIGVREVLVVGNKVRSESDMAFLRDSLPETRFVGFLPDSDSVRLADREGRSAWDLDPEFTEALHTIGAALTDLTAQA
jgi:CO dehydrogenase maturation factor